MGKIVINETSPPPPEILDSDSGPSDDDEVFHHATPVVNPVLPTQQPPRTLRKGTIGDLPRKPVALKPAPQLNVNPYPVASPTPLAFGGTSISSHPVTVQSTTPATTAVRPSVVGPSTTSTPSRVPLATPYSTTTAPAGMFSGLDVHSHIGTATTTTSHPPQNNMPGRPPAGGTQGGGSGLFAGLDTHTHM